jgi:hypothetical protein
MFYNTHKKAKALAITALLMGSQSVFAQSAITSVAKCKEGTLGGMACNLRLQLGDFAALIIGLFYVIGFATTGLGIYFFWKNEQQPNQDFGKKGMIAVMVGGGLISLTYIIEASSASMTGDTELNANDLVTGDIGEGF